MGALEYVDGKIVRGLDPGLLLQSFSIHQRSRETVGLGIIPLVDRGQIAIIVGRTRKVAS
jgi:hypothetical protein